MSIGSIIQSIIALLFIYLIFSLLVSTILEAIASKYEFRAKRLRESIKRILGEEDLTKDGLNYSLTEKLYNSPQFKALNQSSKIIISNNKIIEILSVIVFAVFSICILQTNDTLLITIFLFAAMIIFLAYGTIVTPLRTRKSRNSQGPSYIDKFLFSQALIQVIHHELNPPPDSQTSNGPTTESQPTESSKSLYGPDRNIGEVISYLKTLKEDYPARKKLISYANSLRFKYQNANLSDFQSELSEIFSKAQERSSGVYTRNTKGLSFAIGILVAIIANIDTIYIFQILSKNNNPADFSLIDSIINRSPNESPQTGTEPPQTGTEPPQITRSNLEEFRPEFDEVIKNVGYLPIGWNQEELIIQKEYADLPSLITILENLKISNGKDEIPCFPEDSPTSADSSASIEPCVIQLVDNLQDLKDKPIFDSYITPKVDESEQSSVEELHELHQNFVEDLRRFSECIENENCKTINKFPMTYREYRNGLKRNLLKHQISVMRGANNNQFWEYIYKSIESHIDRQGKGLAIIGWLLSAIAFSMGAPFWFDILNKLVSVRNSGRSLPRTNKDSE